MDEAQSNLLVLPRKASCFWSCLALFMRDLFCVLQLMYNLVQWKIELFLY